MVIHNMPSGRTTVVRPRIARLLLCVIVLAGCGAPAPRATADAVRTDHVRIFDDPSKPETQWGYAPTRILVSRGSDVTFVNGGSQFHTVTSDDASRAFDKGASPSEQVSIRFDKAGTWTYHCGVHPDMKGAVVVCDGTCP